MLSEAASRAVFLEAIASARRAGRLGAIERVLEWPGFRRRLRKRIARWILASARERALPDDDAIESAQWAVFAEYRRLLDRLGAVDGESLENWASRRMKAGARGFLATTEQIVVLNWEAAPGSARRFLAGLLEFPGSIQVTLAIDPSPVSASIYEKEVSERRRFARWGFSEVICAPPETRPGGLRELETVLFRGDRPAVLVGASDGIEIRGVMQGEETARAVAHEVRRALAEGVDPDLVLVVSRHWGGQADLAAEMLADWGLPVHASNRLSLAFDPAIAALRLALELPVGGWEADQLVRLLRHGRVRPDWVQGGSLALAEAAWAVERTGVFRGLAAILDGLERLSQDAQRPGRDEQSERRSERARRAFETAKRFLEPLETLDQPRPWRDQLREIERIASALGLGRGDMRGLDVMLDALADHVETLETLGSGLEAISWAEICREVESLVAETFLPMEPRRPGSIRMTTLDQARGARARVVILFDLEEGTFPTRKTAAAYARMRPGRDLTRKGLWRIGREMVQFLSVLGAAESRLVMVYPSTDLKGRESLRAGFLDNVTRLLAPDALASCSSLELEPSLRLGSPRDLRLWAVAQARRQGRLEALARLASVPEHRPALLGSAVGIHLLMRRRRGAPFSEFEGQLRDGHAVLDLAARLGPDYPYSPSHLETYIACAFRFFCRYVLKLETPLERDEFEDDDALQGRMIHKLLEEYEQSSHDGRARDDSARRFLVDVTMRREKARFTSPGAEEIEIRRLYLLLDRYLDQAEAYAQTAGARRFLGSEVPFGREDDGPLSLEIGSGSRSIRLQGTIDRIDLVEESDGSRFRVIDYKNGKAPTRGQIETGQRLQILLYAWAAQQAELAGPATEPIDMGYWALRGKGYQRVKPEDWGRVKELLGDYIVRLTKSIESGFFGPEPTVENCESWCDYRGVCRIGEVRGSRKPSGLVEPPRLPVQVSSATSRKGGGARTGARVQAPTPEESS